MVQDKRKKRIKLEDGTGALTSLNHSAVLQHGGGRQGFTCISPAYCESTRAVVADGPLILKEKNESSHSLFRW